MFSAYLIATVLFLRISLWLISFLNHVQMMMNLYLLTLTLCYTRDAKIKLVDEIVCFELRLGTVPRILIKRQKKIQVLQQRLL